MKQKSNIYDTDDVERSHFLHFTPEERAARAEQKAEVLGKKLEQAKDQIPKKKKARLQKEADSEHGRLRHRLHVEEIPKKQGKEALVRKAGRKAEQSVRMVVHSKIYQVEEENVGTKAAHRTELTTE